MRDQGEEREVLNRVLANWHRAPLARRVEPNGLLIRITGLQALLVCLVVIICGVALVVTSKVHWLEHHRDHATAPGAHVEGTQHRKPKAHGKRQGSDIGHAPILLRPSSEQYVCEAIQ